MNAFEKQTFRFNERKARRLSWASRKEQARRHVAECRRRFSAEIEKPFVVYYGEICSGIGFTSVNAARLAVLQWCLRNKQEKFEYQIRHFATQIEVFEYTTK